MIAELILGLNARHPNSRGLLQILLLLTLLCTTKFLCTATQTRSTYGISFTEHRRKTVIPVQTVTVNTILGLFALYPNF